MRVISGTFRSRVLVGVDSDKTRETKDRVKESIFNSISNKLQEATVLDLFAGSGSLGIEAISRGSEFCDFVDQEREAITSLRKNILNLRIEENSGINFMDYSSFLEKTYHEYDVVLLDPPYKLDVIDEIIKTIARKKLLASNGVIVCLYSKNNELKSENNGIIEYKKKTIGITNVSYMKWGI
ncbi:Ribosomal RNA small subunit methyltransferase D [Candidatus Izimaplasma bacterium HR1]|jgi:16S rRNA (guanine(966)-N(2))-methyltransferase RsmD|uniref:16S rRNA (guanine(966)-N(2))-methyltransferase RsmD n=1 Tax=Candidatus Izimoplasma sp. HR1 TaxID=1541959 RepID=UPI0004F5CE78|nr:Ribosomal RNA small subunit methyltransferase D [Candidatus Izimaplasma bacterium HR1]